LARDDAALRASTTAASLREWRSVAAVGASERKAPAKICTAGIAVVGVDDLAAVMADEVVQAFELVVTQRAVGHAISKLAYGR
jgi:hypothetical protein